MKHLSRFDIEAIADKYVQAYMALPDVRNTQIYRIDPELLLEKVGAAILLPENLIKQGMYLFSLGEKIECLNKIYYPSVYKRFDALADFLGCSKKALAIRMKQLGLLKKDVIRRYTPFILLSMAQGEVIDESYRNNDKYEKRAKRTIDVYGYEDDISEQFHRELITPFVDPFEQAEEERIEEEKEQLRQLEIAKVRKVLEMLKPVQRERLIKAILLGMSSRKIAKEEGVYYSVVDKSIAAARKNFKKFYENL